MSRNDDFLTAFDEVQQHTQRILGLEGTDFSHNIPVKLDVS
jgi:hypothetical protein